MEADPGEGEDDTESTHDQAVQLHHPLDRGDGGAVELEDEAVVTGRLSLILIIVLVSSFITKHNHYLTELRLLHRQQLHDFYLIKMKLFHQNKDKCSWLFCFTNCLFHGD